MLKTVIDASISYSYPIGELVPQLQTGFRAAYTPLFDEARDAIKKCAAFTPTQHKHFSAILDHFKDVILNTCRSINIITSVPAQEIYHVRITNRNLEESPVEVKDAYDMFINYRYAAYDQAMKANWKILLSLPEWPFRPLNAKSLGESLTIANCLTWVMLDLLKADGSKGLIESPVSSMLSLSFNGVLYTSVVLFLSNVHPPYTNFAANAILLSANWILVRNYYR